MDRLRRGFPIAIGSPKSYGCAVTGHLGMAGWGPERTLKRRGTLPEALERKRAPTGDISLVGTQSRRCRDEKAASSREWG
jgi:hypothetical protein